MEYFYKIKQKFTAVKVFHMSLIKTFEIYSKFTKVVFKILQGTIYLKANTIDYMSLIYQVQKCTYKS